MGLTSTLFTGMSGLNVNQTKLDVVGNNIANVNTTAFKGSRAIFKPQFYITDSSGSPASDVYGGRNPTQHGLGAEISTIQKNWNPGALETTGRDTDMALDGEGFFVVDGPEGQLFTRDGSFNLNENNQLVTTDGQFVQGFGVDDNENIISGALKNVQIPLGSLTKARQTENAKFEGNLNAAGNLASAATILNSESLTTAGGAAPTAGTALAALRKASDPAAPLFNAGETITLAGRRGGRELTPLNFTINAGSTVGELTNFFNQGLGIETTLAPAAGPPPGATFGALPTDAPGTARFIIDGNQGEQNALTLTGSGFTTSGGATMQFSEGSDLAGNASGAVGESVNTTVQAFDSLGTPLSLDMTLVLDGKTGQGTDWRFYANSPQDTDAATFDPAGGSKGTRVGTGLVHFDNNGRLIGAEDATIQINRDATGAANPVNIDLNFGQMTALSSQKSELFGSQDGTAIGTLTNFSVGGDGTIVGGFDNGLTGTLGRIAIATFDNPQGLTDQGSNLLRTGTNSGTPKISGPQDLTAGTLRSGSLELSNVDLSNEFINMIVASTGFSAASRVITTSNQLMTELLQTAR